MSIVFHKNWFLNFRDMTGFGALVNGDGEVTDFLRLQNITKRARSWRERERAEKVRKLLFILDK